MPAKKRKLRVTKKAKSPWQDKRWGLFVQAYIANGMVGSHAYREVFGQEVQPHHAKLYAHRLLQRPEIQSEIEEYIDAKLADAGLRFDRVLDEYMAVGFSNMQDVASWSATEGLRVKPSDQLPPHVAAAIAEISAEWEQYNPPGDDQEPIWKAKVRIRLHPKIEALGKLYELFELGAKARAAREGGGEGPVMIDNSTTNYVAYFPDKMSETDWRKHYAVRDALPETGNDVVHPAAPSHLLKPGTKNGHKNGKTEGP